MKTPFLFKTFLTILLLFNLFIFRESLIWKDLKPRFFITQKQITFSDPSGRFFNLFPAQEEHNLKTNNLLQLSSPNFFFTLKSLNQNDLKADESWQNKNFVITKISPNLIQIQTQEQKILVFYKDFEFSETIKKPINLDSDIWIIESTTNLEKIPLPTQLIILSSQAPNIGNNLKSRIINAQTPLIKTKQVSPAILEFIPDKNWILKTF